MTTDFSTERIISIARMQDLDGHRLYVTSTMMATMMSFWVPLDIPHRTTYNREQLSLFMVSPARVKSSQVDHSYLSTHSYSDSRLELWINPNPKHWFLVDLHPSIKYRLHGMNLYSN